MAVTFVHLASSQDTAATSQTRTTGTFRPPNKCTLVVFIECIRDNHATAYSFQNPTTSAGSLTWTQRVTPFGIDPTGSGSNFRCEATCYTAPVDISPGDITLTVDAFSGTETAYYSVQVIAVLGANNTTPLAQSAATNSVNPGATDTQAQTVTLGSNPTSGNGVLALFAPLINSSSAPTTPSGYTVVSAPSGVGARTCVYFHNSTTTAAIQSTDLGQQVVSSNAIALEFAQATNPPTVVASGGGAITTSRSPAVTFTGYVPFENDVVVLWASSTTTGHTMTEPSGWVNPLGSGVDVESDAHQIACAYHLVTSGEASGGTTTYTATNWYGATTTGYTQGAVLRTVDTTTPVDSANSTFDSGNTVTPHVLASLTGANLSTDSLVLSSVAKDGTGAYSSVPSGWSQLRADNTNNGRWLGFFDTYTTAGNNVAATNITPSAGDEYASITVAFTAVSSGATGTVAVTEANDTASAAGWHTVTGTSAQTEANDSSAASGAETFTGTAAPSEANDTGTAAGWHTVSGTSATTDANDTASATGAETFTGTAAPTEADDTASAAGTLTISGTVAVTEANDTASGAGWHTVSGTSAQTEANDTADAAGEVTSENATGSAAVTEANDTASASGVLTITGTAAPTESADTSAAAGAETFTGTSATTDANDTASATGWHTISGTAARTEDADTSAASGTVGDAPPPVTGSGSPSEANDTATTAAAVIFTGTSATTDANDTASAAGAVVVSGTSATTEANDTGSAAGALTIAGLLAVTEANDTATATGGLTIIGSGTATENDDTAFGIEEVFVPIAAPRIHSRAPGRIRSEAADRIHSRDRGRMPSALPAELVEV